MENKTLKITLKTSQWNSIFSVMARLNKTTEVQGIFETVKKQTENKEAEEFTVEFALADVNLMIDILKIMPFYLVHDLIIEIVSQGREQLAEAEKAKKESGNVGETAKAE